MATATKDAPLTATDIKLTKTSKRGEYPIRYVTEDGRFAVVRESKYDEQFRIVDTRGVYVSVGSHTYYRGHKKPRWDNPDQLRGARERLAHHYNDPKSSVTKRGEAKLIRKMREAHRKLTVFLCGSCGGSHSGRTSTVCSCGAFHTDRTNLIAYRIDRDNLIEASKPVRDDRFLWRAPDIRAARAEWDSTDD